MILTTSISPLTSTLIHSELFTRILANTINPKNMFIQINCFHVDIQR